MTVDAKAIIAEAARRAIDACGHVPHVSIPVGACVACIEHRFAWIVLVLNKLRALAIRSHYYCEDSWYSCPKTEDGCSDELAGTECNCGADEHNQKVKAVFARLPRARG
jgi:hypothetical protein